MTSDNPHLHASPVEKQARRPPDTPRDGKPGRAALASGQVLFGAILFATCLLVGMIVGAAKGDFSMLPIAGLVLLLPVGAITLNLYSRRRVRGLWRTGDVAPAEMIESWRKTGGSGESATQSWWVRYRYEVKGQTYTTKHAVAWKCELNTIWAIYDPAEPGRSLPHW